MFFGFNRVVNDNFGDRSGHGTCKVQISWQCSGKYNRLSLLIHHRRVQRGWGLGVRTSLPLENHKAIQPLFSIGPSNYRFVGGPMVACFFLLGTGNKDKLMTKTTPKLCTWTPLSTHPVEMDSRMCTVQKT